MLGRKSVEQATRRATIADVAEAAGVSKTAVSFAFNSPDRLGTATASRILEVAGSLGYRPPPPGPPPSPPPHASSPLPAFPWVEGDDEPGARAAAEHLLALGHRDILVIGVEPPHPAGREDPEGVMNRRLPGYRAAIEAAGLELSDDHVVVGPASIAGGMAAFEGAWGDGLRPTGILAISDAIAVRALHA